MIVYFFYLFKELCCYVYDNWQIVDVQIINGLFEDINVDEFKIVWVSVIIGIIMFILSFVIFSVEQVGKLFYFEQLVVDFVLVWEISKSILIEDIWCVDSNYYCVNIEGKIGMLCLLYIEGMVWDGWGGIGDDDIGV